MVTKGGVKIPMLKIKEAFYRNYNSNTNEKDLIVEKDLIGFTFKLKRGRTTHLEVSSVKKLGDNYEDLIVTPIEGIIQKEVISESDLQNNIVDTFNQNSSVNQALRPSFIEAPQGRIVEFEYSEEKGKFDFAFVTIHQIAPLFNMKNLIVLGTKVKFGTQIDSSITQREHFTLRIEGHNLVDDKNDEVPFPSISLALVPPSGITLPLIQLGFPCPPDWNTDSELVQLLLDSV